MDGFVNWASVVMTFVNKTDWTTVLVAVASGGSAIFGNFWLWARQAKKERESVRAGLLAEVSALVEIAERRGYLGYLWDVHNLLLCTADEVLEERPLETFELRVPIGEHHNRVYQQNVGKLGMLSPREVRQIVRFYQLIDSFRSDVVEGGVLYDGNKDFVVWQGTALVLQEALQVGRQLTQPKHSWWRRLSRRGQNVDAEQTSES